MNSAVAFLLLGIFLVWVIATGRGKAVWLAITKGTGAAGNYVTGVKTG